MLTSDDVALGDQPAATIRQEMVSKKVYPGATPMEILEHVRKRKDQGKDSKWRNPYPKPKK
jgi:hypothetical protein